MKRLISTYVFLTLVLLSCKKDKGKKADPKAPVVTTAALTNVAGGNATAGGSIVSDGGSTITKAGVVWSRTNSTPTITDSLVASLNISGTFKVTITGIEFGNTYYFRAFASNTVGTGYGDVIILNTTGDTSKVRFTYNGKEVVYGIIISSATGKKWLDRNLGATRVATSVDDYQAYGDLFQWGRADDGHQLINWTSSTTGSAVNGTIAVLATSDIPGHNNFITPPHPSIPDKVVIWDWRSDNNSNRWAINQQGPCPAGWHVPAIDEWLAEVSKTNGGTANAGITNQNTAYNQLRLTAAGYRVGDGPDNEMGQLGGVGKYGFYWSSTDQNNLAGYTNDRGFEVGRDFTQEAPINKSGGVCVRCIKG